MSTEDEPLLMGRMPFGLPDGARVDIEASDYGFVEFADARLWGALATRQSDLRARVFFGRKGSGKTIYLRRLEAYISKQDDLYSTSSDCKKAKEKPHSVRSDYNPLETKPIVKFGHYFSFDTVTEAWMQLWRIAILRSVAAQIIFHPNLKDRFSEHELDSLRKYTSTNGVDPLEIELPIYDNVRLLIAACHSPQGAIRLLEDPAWVKLDAHLKKMISKCPPMCFYLDAIDDEFAHAPMYWVRCQMGLFYQLMRLLRDKSYGGRLHVFACLRDLVQVRILSSEHAMRYMEEEYIRPLFWNFRAAQHFLERKIKSLASSYFVNYNGSGSSAERWLGINQIYNKARSINEPIEQYLLRHTRLLPRDIIILGNELCRAISEGRLNPENKDREKNFREVISRCARDFAKEQLMICSNQISSDQMPVRAADMDISEIYTSISEYKTGIPEKLKALVKSIGVDRFKLNSISRRRSSMKRQFEEADPLNAMWQNGLIGYVDRFDDKERMVFYGDQVLRKFKLPEADEYVFHPCLIDEVKIKSVGSNPVIPYLED